MTPPKTGAWGFYTPLPLDFYATARDRHLSARRRHWGDAASPGTFSDAGMVVAGRLLHDHPGSHAARRTQQLLYRLGWEMFDHPTYSLLLPATLFVSEPLRFQIKQYFPCDDVQTCSCHRLAPLSSGGFDTGFSSWSHGCFNSSDSYV
ncbi:hypothetical protein AVEN_203561-1 [Araneus ventricosus]|uniref:Uncharacterized protein n=1 Tax=Araneus ventricosus TaxID=182803 RepID=A0A4Y2FMD0_ARAVE|nr:hypothetical protein AVEN_203561-1 [Araneus ventricosus]